MNVPQATGMVLVEGGPLDGERLPDYGAHTVRVPRQLPLNVLSLRNRGLSIETIEYERCGSVYRWPGLIRDARAAMGVSGELFREAPYRALVRSELRRELERLGGNKVVDRIVWVVWYDLPRMTWTVAAVVGGRRAEHARALRDQRKVGVSFSDVG